MGSKDLAKCEKLQGNQV